MKSNFTILLSFALLLFAHNCAVAAPPCVIAPITGATHVCMGSSATLNDVTAGGSWMSSNTAVANIGSSSGLVTTVSPGVATITYSTSPGCSVTTDVTVTAMPGPILGSLALCVGSSTIVSDALPGGIWASDNPSVLSVGSTSGIASAVGIGGATISYTVGGCAVSEYILINWAIPPIGNPGTPLCPADQMTLTESFSCCNWSSSNPSVATVGSSSGVVTGVSGGTAVITYGLSPTCCATSIVSVNPSPAPISGSNHVCLGSTDPLTDVSPGGFWSTSNPGIAAISGGGVVNGVMGGYDTITYTLSGTGCTTHLGLTVIDLGAIFGDSSLCAWGDTASLSVAYTGGLFTSTLATVTNLGGGLARLTANAPGTATVTYTIPAGCSVTKMVTVNPLPMLITGDFHVCSGFTTSLADVTPGGAWSSDSIAIATVSTTGVVTGSTVGVAHIFYTLPTGCKVDTTVIVAAPPSVIGGPDAICVGATATMTDSVSGGAWSSSSPGYVSINPTTGLATASFALPAVITYSLGGTCQVSKVLSVNPLPALYLVTGGGAYCAGGTGVHVFLGGSQPGVDYQLYNGTTTVDTPRHGSGSLIDFGLQPGAGSYTVVATNIATGCVSPMGGSVTVTVHSLPTVFPVTGGGSYCDGSSGAHVGLGGSQSGVSYQLFNAGLPSGGAMAGTGGLLDFGAFTGAGPYTIVAINTTTGCSDTMAGGVTTTITPTVIPSVILSSSWGDTVCSGVSVTYTATPYNGGTLPLYQWMVNGVAVGAGGPTYSYLPANGDHVRTVLTSSAACAVPDTVGAEMVMTVIPALIPLVTVVASPGTSISKGQTVTFTATATGAGPSPTYQWMLNGGAIPGAVTATYVTSTLQNGDIVGCVVTSGGLCGGHTGNNSVAVTVNTTAINNVAATGMELKVMPNPNKGAFLISGQMAGIQTEDVTIALSDMLGREVYKRTVTAVGGKLGVAVTIPDLNNGIYLLSVRGATVRAIERVVVE